MHYLCFALIDAEGDPKALVDALMAPHDETTREEGGFFDWFQMGGRWTGYLDGYDPKKDPANLRPDGRPEWPTSWVGHDGDVQPVEVARARCAADDGLPHTLVGGGEPLFKSAWDGSDFVDTPDFEAKVRARLAAHTGRVAIVDYHS